MIWALCEVSANINHLFFSLLCCDNIWIINIYVDHGRALESSSSALNPLRGGLRLLCRVESVKNENLICKYIILFSMCVWKLCERRGNDEISQPQGFHRKSSNEVCFYINLPKSGIWKCLFDFSVTSLFIASITWNTDYSKSHICSAWDIFLFHFGFGVLCCAVHCVLVLWDLKNTQSNVFTLKPLLSEQWHCVFWNRLEERRD